MIVDKWCTDVPTLLGKESTLESQQLAWPGQRRHFTCSATALPLPTITWSRRGGLFVVDSDTYRVNASTQQLSVTSTLQVLLAVQPIVLLHSMNDRLLSAYCRPSVRLSVCNAVSQQSFSTLLLVLGSETAVLWQDRSQTGLGLGLGLLYFWSCFQHCCARQDAVWHDNAEM